MSAELIRPVAVAGLALAATALVAACASAGLENPVDAEQPFETVLAATHSGLSGKRRDVVRDEAAWARLWDEIHAASTPRPPRPPVDFTRHMLIVVASGTHPSGGFGVKVQGIVTRGARLQVAVHETCPAPGAMVTMELTQPLEVVRVPSLAQPVTFRETRAASCR